MGLTLAIVLCVSLMTASDRAVLQRCKHSLERRQWTGVVSMAVSDEGSETHFEAFQVQKYPLLRPGSGMSPVEPVNQSGRIL